MSLTYLVFFKFFAGASNQAVVVITPGQGGAGNLDWRGVKPTRRRKKRGEVVRYAELEELEAKAQALADASVKAARIRDDGTLEDDDIEAAEEALLAAMVMRIYH